MIGDSKFGSSNPKYNKEKYKNIITYQGTLIKISNTLYSIILL